MTLITRTMRFLLSPLVLRFTLLKSASAFISAPNFVNPHYYTATTASTTKLTFSSDNSPPQAGMENINKQRFSEILQRVEAGNAPDVVVIDVRNAEEIMQTGKVSDVVETLPLPYIMQSGAFDMESEDFEENFGFEKPTPDRTIVFTCKAGIRSVYAAQFAEKAGYSSVMNYMGGSDEWFSGGGAEW